MSIKRAEIYWVDLNPTRGSEQRGLRPCVVVSIDALNKHRRTVLVVPLSSSPRPIPPLAVATPSGRRAESVALCEQVRAIDRTRLGTRIGVMNTPDMLAPGAALREVQGI